MWLGILPSWFDDCQIVTMQADEFWTNVAMSGIESQRVKEEVHLSVTDCFRVETPRFGIYFNFSKIKLNPKTLKPIHPEDYTHNSDVKESWDLFRVHLFSLLSINRVINKEKKRNTLYKEF